MTVNKAKLVASDIAVQFGGLIAVSGVNLELEQGEIVGLIGSNGAGKSTLINIMSGFQKPSSGTVTLGGVDISALSPARIARSGLVRTFQSVRLFPELTVRENVAAAAAVLNLPRGRIDDILFMLGLKEQQGRFARELAYAHQRRLAIGRALALSPRFLLLDEPAAGMTPIEVNELGALLVTLRGLTGTGLLLVEHNMSLVMNVCERIVVMDGGKVIARGLPADIQSNPRVRQAYLGHGRD